jgi:hypothetical protein
MTEGAGAFRPLNGDPEWKGFSPGFIPRIVDLSRFDKTPVAKAISFAGWLFRSLKAPAPSVSSAPKVARTSKHLVVRA